MKNKITFKGLLLALSNTTKSPAEQQKAIIFYQLDKIYDVCKSIAEEWGVKTIPLATLKEVIRRAKPSTDTGNEFTDKLNVAYNKTLDSLYHASTKIARRMNSKSVPLSEVKKGLDIIKGAYNKN